jgi:hypothetical protein
MLNFINFVRRKWSEVSESTGQKGTVIDEMAVKPTGLILGEFYNSLASERRVNNASNWESMSDSELDFFGNKFFTPRIVGDFSFGFARIWFDIKINFEITSETRFVSGNGLRYKAVQPGFINSGSFNRSTDRFALYYVDIPIIAESKGDNYNIEIGSITQIVNINFSYKIVSNTAAIVNGAMSENNSQYFKRLTYAVNDKSMMNKRSIYAKLPEFFPIIHSQYIAAAGDRYMMRDLVEAVNVSEPSKEATFLGKVQGENMVKSVGFYQIFPLEAGNSNASVWGPRSPVSAYDYPLTIDPFDIASLEPAFHGYATNQECTDEMYKGLFFDDFKTYMEVTTRDLFNIFDEGLTYTPVQTPSSDWIYGANGYSSSNMGELSDGINAIDVLNFSSNTIQISGGAINTICAGKNINKRIGVKVAGSFKWPDSATDPMSLALNSDIQIMVGGVNGDIVDAYSGIGFGVRVNSKYDSEQDPTPINNQNATIYFAHSEKYGTAQVYLTDEDLGNAHMIGNINALAETSWRIEPGIEYEFEFIIYDDLRMTLYLNKTSNQLNSGDPELGDIKHFKLAATSLNVFGSELKSESTSRYGTMLKVAVDTQSQSIDDKWQVINLRSFDIAEKKATAMFALDANDLETPISVFARANGSSAVDGLVTSGYQAYIWDKEGESVASGQSELTQGGWTLLPSLSNPDGSKNSLQSLFSADVGTADRYKVQNKFGKNIFILFATTGTTKLKSTFANEVENDIHSTLHIDYINAESGLVQSYHAHNKSDIYVTTLSNTENLAPNSVVLNKQANENYFEMSVDNGCLMPVADIVSVTIGTSVNNAQVLGSSSYTVVKTDPLLTGSVKEKIKIYLIDTDSSAITVEYTTYPIISNIQSFFDGSTYGKVIGDILAKHKSPFALSFTIYYSGLSNDVRVTDAIKKYFDTYVINTFVVKDMISYLYNQSIVNNIQEPITVSYSRYDDSGNIQTGTFTDKIDATNIEFFRIVSLAANTL